MTGRGADAPELQAGVRLGLTRKASYLEGTVHQSLIQVYDHADLSLVLGFHGRQEAEFVLLTGQETHTHLKQGRHRQALHLNVSL